LSNDNGNSISGMTPEMLAAAAARTAQDPSTQPITLLVTFDPLSGSVSLSGPIANKLLIYGMLEMAREAVSSFDPKKGARDEPKVLVPRPRFGR
jgi:hypothetical protein